MNFKLIISLVVVTLIMMSGANAFFQQYFVPPVNSFIDENNNGWPDYADNVFGNMSTVNNSLYLDGENSSYYEFATHDAGMLREPSISYDNVSNNVTLGDVTAILYDNSGFSGVPRRYDIESANVTITEHETNYIIIRYNDGNPIYDVTTNVEIIDESNIIPVYTVFEDMANTFHYLDWDSIAEGLANKLHFRQVKTDRFERESGLQLEELDDRVFAIGGGKIFVGAHRLDIDYFQSNITEPYFYYHDNGDWNLDLTETRYNNLQYDDGTDLVELNNNDYGINWIYRGTEEQDHAFMVLGEESYNKVADAIEAQPRSDLPEILKTNAFLVGRIIVKKNADSATRVDSAFEEIFVPSTITDHGNLAGLLDNDHPQYVLDSGDTMTGDLNVSADIYANEVFYTNPVAQYHRESNIDTQVADEWQNVTFDVAVLEEITNGYELVNNNESIQVNFSGIVKFQGKVTVINDATATETQKIAMRIINNGIENRCTQVSSNTNRVQGAFNTIPITGTSRVEPGDNISLQYRVNDINLDIAGDPVFDTPVAASLNLEKITS